MPRASEPLAASASTHLSEDAELRSILEGTARSAGKEFFEELVRHLAAVIDVHHAFVAEFAGSPSRVRTLAFWSKDRLVPQAEWDLPGTPCQDVLKNQVCHHPEAAWRKFPEDRPLVEMRIESYLGVPLL